MVQIGSVVAFVCFGVVASSRIASFNFNSLDTDFACDTTLDQRNQIRAQVLAEVERDGFVSASSESTVAFAEGESEEATLEKPSNAMAYLVNPHSMFYQMHSPKDVIVWVGCSPPKGAWYFGCTQYLNYMGESIMDKLRGPFASVTDSLNQLNINTTGEEFWESTFVVITTADIESAAVVRRALETAHPALSRAINIQIIPSLIHPDLHMETGSEGASFSTGCRLAPGSVSAWDMNSQDEAAAYLTHVEPLLVLDGSQIHGTPQPFANPLKRPLASGNRDEMQLQGAFAQLVCRIQQHAFDLGFVPTRRNGENVFAPLKVRGKDHYLNGTQCIVEGGNCIQDSPDALYMKSKVDSSHMQVVVSVNHRLTGTAAYGYVIAYHGDFTVHDRQSEGSARPWADDLPEASLFTVLTVMQDEEACSRLPADMRTWCYNGGHRGINYVERAYLNPITATAPDPDELLPSTVLRFQRRRFWHNERPDCLSHA